MANISKIRFKDVINPSKWFSFLFGWLYSTEQHLKEHVFEQLMMRRLLCSKCVREDDCVICGCDTWKKMLVLDETDSHEEGNPALWGPVMDKVDWEVFKKQHGIRFMLWFDTDEELYLNRPLNDDQHEPIIHRLKDLQPMANIEFERTVYDLGTIEPKAENLHIEFPFQGNPDAIEEIRPDCGCTANLKIDDQNNKIVGTYTDNGKNDKFRKGITLLLDDGKPIKVRNQKGVMVRNPDKASIRLFIRGRLKK